MKTSDFDYHLPPELIAQTPIEPRDASRLLVVHRETGTLAHRHFHQIGEYFQAGDMLVGNDSRVIPARLLGRKESGGHVEFLLLEKMGETRWQALVRGKKSVVGTVYKLSNREGEITPITATVVEMLNGPQRIVEFSERLEAHWAEIGHTPLPPYIHQAVDDPERYQTVYARPEGSAAAPTAGLHFSGPLMLSLREQKVAFERVTLHVGLDTFKPVETELVEAHQIHSESIAVSFDTAQRLNHTKVSGGRIIAIGTTSARTLESVAWRAAGFEGSLRAVSPLPTDTIACPWKPFVPFDGKSDLFIHPPYRFRAVDALITNFHLPKSSLLMMISAFAGYELMRHVYETAIAEKYRFFSFGDAMLIL